MTLKTLIVDDEPLALDGLRMFLAEDPDISRIEAATNGREAVTAIRERRPDLVFLDLQMPEMDGFEVIEEVGADLMPAVVFVTAHDRYAIRAFEMNALDYLLKPVARDRFEATLKRAKTRFRAAPSDTSQSQIISLLETIASPGRYLKRVAVKSAGKTIFVNVEEVDWIQAAENYVELHTRRATHLLHVGLSALEKSLDPDIFVRIHRSIIVNVRRIKELRAASFGEYVVVLEDGLRLQSSRSYTQKIRSLTRNPF